ncbi:hypothetical protein, partial [Sciscionella sediminilitoris]|uniref:hypothetical protein n=1 Tax=Sciscionella sediminilitoris TaxID=1445613 RepID=UPI001E5AC652
PKTRPEPTPQPCSQHPTWLNQPETDTPSHSATNSYAVDLRMREGLSRCSIRVYQATLLQDWPELSDHA